MAEPAFDPRLAPKIQLTDVDRASINADINKVAMKLRERASNSGASIASTTVARRAPPVRDGRAS